MENKEKTPAGVTEEKPDIVRECREYVERVWQFESENRAAAKEDLLFLSGDQWTPEDKTNRYKSKRPMLVQNMLPKFVEQVLGDARQNKPAPDIKPADGDARQDVAEIYEGLYRNIEYVGNACYARETALERSVEIGWGYHGLVIKDAAVDSFEKEIAFRRFPDSLSVYYDPDCVEADGSDSMRCAVLEEIPVKVFKQDYPNASTMSVDSHEPSSIKWFTEDTIILAEYWRREKVLKEVALVEISTPEGEVIKRAIYHAEDVQGILSQVPGFAEGLVKVLKTEKKTDYKVTRHIVSGNEELETVEWPGRYIPIFPTWGREIRVDGSVIREGIIRQAKDPQRAYNYWWTDLTERAAMAPKALIRVTEAMIKGYEDEWDNLNRNPKCYIRYNYDPQAPSSGPQQVDNPQTYPAQVQLLNFAAQGLMEVIGIFNAQLGAPSNEKSGRAIMAKQRQGDTGTYRFIDNHNRALIYEGKAMLDLIPKVYDTPRMLRVLDKAGRSKLVPVNQPVKQMDGATGEPKKDQEGNLIMDVFDLTLGRYDMAVAIGPAYTTKREEAVDKMTAILQTVPNAAPVILPRLMENLDIEDAKDIAEEVRALLQPQQQMMPPNPNQGGGGGQVPVPGEINPGSNMPQAAEAGGAPPQVM